MESTAAEKEGKDDSDVIFRPVCDDGACGGRSACGKGSGRLGNVLIVGTGVGGGSLVSGLPTNIFIIFCSELKKTESTL